jgi:glycosyltransferase involved in cell wall biosynthesis
VLYLVKNKIVRIGYLSSYPPRECGIATFTKDLIDALVKIEGFIPTVIALNDKNAIYDYDFRVRLIIDKDYIEDYKKAADYINSSNIDLVHIQHEFGLYGGENGSYIVDFLERLKKPVITTLHTVQPDFDQESLKILRIIAEKSLAIIVIARVAVDMLKKQKIPLKKCVVIPHGCPYIEKTDGSAAKKALGLDGRIVASTFGLINRGKGIEYVIEALPEVIKQEPSIVYLVVGETHPEVRKAEGEQYRNELMKKVCELGIKQNVRFTNRYLTKRKLIKYLQATDIYLTPYNSANQISSGSLIFAMGAGKAIISTPYFHAVDVLASGRGLFCEFRDSDSISKAMIRLLDEPFRRKMQSKVFKYSRRFLWESVAKKHAILFKEIMKIVKTS